MSDALNILVVTPPRPIENSGNDVTASRWARLLRDLGHDVRLAAGDDGKPADVLVALHARRSGAAIESFAERAPQASIVCALTGTDLYGDVPGENPTALRSLALADVLVVLHDMAPAALPARFRSKARVIHQSVEPPKHRETPRPDVFEVCVIGHLRAVKDPLRAAHAARRLPASSRVLVTHAGAAIEPEFAEAARREMARNPRYDWIGPVEHEVVLRILTRSRVHVITSRSEGGANVVCEAIACDVPTLTSAIPGTLGILGDDYPGVFPGGDTDALARLLHRAETEPRFLTDLRERCRGRAHLVRPETERKKWAALLDELPAKEAS